MNSVEDISSQFPYESKYVEVLGSKLHYIEEGEGKPILFLHGIPSSSYLWRNVIPHVAKHGRCIALDLIGMGQSDKPDIEYRVLNHIRYIEAFIKALDLHDITLVLHGWGSVIGFDYAMRHEDNLRALIFFEAHLRPATDRKMLSLPMQELAAAIHSFDGGFDAMMEDDKALDQWLHRGMMRRLTKEEMQYYQKPFKTSQDRKPLMGYLKDFQTGEGTTETSNLIKSYSDKLQKSHLPKLMFYAIPGFNTTVDTIIWARDNLKKLTLSDLGEALHFFPETQPEALGQKISEWLQGVLPSTA